MRAFIAIDLDKGLLDNVKEIQKSLRQAGADVKFVEPENLHFTVKFLGKVQENALKSIVKALENSVSGMKAFRISIEGLRYFGPESHIRTLFLDVKENREKFQELLNSVNNGLNYVRHESHEPRPHLTILRVKSRNNREALMEKIRELSHVKLGEMNVKSVKLKQSVLTRSGPVYSDVKVIELQD
jgi:2'-5' RNA ligase